MARRSQNPSNRGAHIAVSKFCMVRSNRRLHMLIKRAWEKSGMSIYQVAMELGVHRGRVGQYLNNFEENTHKGKKALTQYDVIKLAEMFGIKISLRIELDAE